ncbi:MAG: sigma-70 family RNA polymerase sigma factor [Planctomycetota bacterium]
MAVREREVTRVDSDSALIRAFQRGSGEAFRALYERYRRAAFLYALALAGDEHVAEEAVQEAYLTILRNLRRYDPRGSFRSYLLAAIRCRVIDTERKKAVRREVTESEAAAGAEVDLFEIPAPAVTEDHLGPAVSRALLALPREQREVIVLKVYEEMTFREIALLTGASENTMASRYRYACDKLRGLLRGVVTHE